MRQPPDQADGIHQNDMLPIGKHQFPRRRVQRGKELILGKNARLGQPVEQSGFSHICIAHQSNRFDTVFLPAAADPPPADGQFRQLQLQRLNSPADMPAVAFQLALPGAARSNAAALAGELVPHPDQAGQQVFLLGKFHLELALVGTGTRCKNIQDEHSTIDHIDPQEFFDIPDLAAGQFIVKDHEIYLLIGANRLYLS